MSTASQFVTALVLASGISASAAESVKMLPAVPDSLPPPLSWQTVGNGSFYEIQASRAEQARELLGDFSFRVLEKERPSDIYFSDMDRKCVKPNHLILLRANYISGATGSFSLNWSGDSLIVIHAFLGSATQVHESAVVACLSRIPKNVYGAMPGAM
jgi:hypothetical protein